MKARELSSISYLVILGHEKQTEEGPKRTDRFCGMQGAGLLAGTTAPEQFGRRTNRPKSKLSRRKKLQTGLLIGVDLGTLLLVGVDSGGERLTKKEQAGEEDYWGQSSQRKGRRREFTPISGGTIREPTKELSCEAHWFEVTLSYQVATVCGHRDRYFLGGRQG